MINVNNIYHGDAFELIKEIASESVDLVVTSPPYADRRKQTYGGKPHDEYVEWFLPLSEQMLRIFKPTGSFILNIKENVVEGQRSPYVFDLIKSMQIQGWFWTETYIWHKTNAMPGKWPNRLRDAWEYCFHFTKQRKFNMYQDSVKIPMGDWAVKRMKMLSKNDRERSTSATGSGFGRLLSNWEGKELVYPDNVIAEKDIRWRDILTCLLEEGISQQKTSSAIVDDILDAIDEFSGDNVLQNALVGHNKMHSAVFPEKLPEFFIKLFTVEGDLVFDPFLGSGTTAKVAKTMKREFLGFEMKKEYYDLAASRLGIWCEDDIFPRF